VTSTPRSPAHLRSRRCRKATADAQAAFTGRAESGHQPDEKTVYVMALDQLDKSPYRGKSTRSRTADASARRSRRRGQPASQPPSMTRFEPVMSSRGRSPGTPPRWRHPAVARSAARACVGADTPAAPGPSPVACAGDDLAWRDAVADDQLLGVVDGNLSRDVDRSALLTPYGRSPGEATMPCWDPRLIRRPGPPAAAPG